MDKLKNKWPTWIRDDLHQMVDDLINPYLKNK